MSCEQDIIREIAGKFAEGKPALVNSQGETVPANETSVRPDGVLLDRDDQPWIGVFRN